MSQGRLPIEDALKAHLLEDWRKAHDIWSSIRNALSGGTVINGSDVDKVDGMDAADFNARKMPTEIKTDSYAITSADYGKMLVMDSSEDKVFTLLSAEAASAGEFIVLVKWGTGKVTIQLPGGNYIHSPDGNSTAGGTLYNAADQYSRVLLRIVKASEWLLWDWTGTAWVLT